MIFALLPLQYENTFWISARSHLISFSASMAALLALDRFTHESRGRPLAACALLLTLALLTYEAAVVHAGARSARPCSHEHARYAGHARWRAWRRWWV